ncbi:MAG: YozE family protein [Alkalibacterium sp.]|nr:YozE family protein [Alkalibacterium sp.]TVP91508.1 MAG: YozE family protein [Alkalibacterium sp.]
MRRSFYHYVKTIRDPYKKDEVTLFANSVDKDGSFPKQSEDYDEISRYLEIDADYVDSMSVFDEVFQNYIDNNK